MNWTLMIHGGAGRITRATISAEIEAATRRGLAAALEAGAAILAAGSSALDAVEAAICVLEDDPAFNAGRGAALTAAGTAELDAAIMDGTTRDAGAVAGATTSKNPVRLARAVLAQSPHVLLIGPGADTFAAEQRIETACADWFVTPERRRQHEELRAHGGFDAEMKYGTVGAVARDAHGHLAAATSTGGVTGQRAGRVGDSPLIGAGTWADDRAAAVSCTGSGEQFIRAGAAAQLASRMRFAGQSLEAATAATLAEVQALGGTGGLIAVAPSGEAVWRFTTPGMNRGIATSGGERRLAVFRDE